MILKVRKDFMVFKQRDFIAKWFTVVDFIRSKQFFYWPVQRKTRPLSLFCELGISSHDQLCLKVDVNLWRKKGKQIFSKTVRGSELTCTWQGTLRCRWTTLTSIVATVDSICKKGPKKTVSFTVIWQKKIKLCVSSQKGELFKLSTFSFQSAYKKIKTTICHVWKYCKDPTVVHLLFTATCSRINSPVNQTSRFFS